MSDFSSEELNKEEYEIEGVNTTNLEDLMGILANRTIFNSKPPPVFEKDEDIERLLLQQTVKEYQTNKFIKDLCTFITDMLYNQKKSKVLNTSIYIFDNSETPTYALFNKDMGGYIINSDNSYLPKGTICLPAPSNVLYILRTLNKNNLFSLIENGLETLTAQDVIFKLKHVRKIGTDCSFKRGAENSVIMNSSGFGLFFSVQPIYLDTF